MNNRPRSRSLAQWLLPLASNTEALRCELLFPVRPRGEHLHPCMLTAVEMQVRRSAVMRAFGIDRLGPTGRERAGVAYPFGLPALLSW